MRRFIGRFSKLGNMSKSIVNNGGGGQEEALENDVNFYDYDGFRVASYTIAEAKALTALPTPPTHEGLTFQEWNWTLADIQSYGRQYIDVGANYTPMDSKTHIKWDTGDTLDISLAIWTKKSNGILVEWGDGDSDVYDGISTTGSNITKSHTYQTSGIYDIKVSIQSGTDSYYVRTVNPNYHLIEINLSNECLGVYTRYAGDCKLSVSKNIVFQAFDLGYSWIRQVTVPRNTNYDFSTQYDFYIYGQICFPPSVPAFGTRTIGGYKKKVVIPELSGQSETFALQSLILSTFCHVLSLPLTWQYPSAPVTNQGLSGFSALCKLDLVQGWTPQTDINFSSSTQWDAIDIVDIFNRLGTTTNAITLTWGVVNLDKLSAEEKAIATNKGYTLA